jgi:Holliday junction resolvase-like predicted endonuclease
MNLEKNLEGAAKKYSDCRVKCLQCEVAYSNAKKSPTLIFKEYLKNIPQKLHNNLVDILNNSLNNNNRQDKIAKMCFYNSEDAFTWIFFTYFLCTQKEDGIKEIFKISEDIIDIYFWGTGYKNTDSEFRKKLENVLKNNFFEKNDYFSEPDIIIITLSKIVFVEIKVKSGNNFQDVISKYLKDEYYKDIKKAKKSKCYELIRNWSIGNSIATNYKKEFILCNIGLKQKIDLDGENTNRKLFKESLKNGNYSARST